ncbi:MAG: hypothetical protein ACFB4I_13560 [Cyanophyceae cyanobacterium]
MKTMGAYCKAYPLHQLRQFSQWAEQTDNTRKVQQIVDGQTVEVSRVLTDEDFLYLQENYVVTDGIYLDENVVFDRVCPEWVAFCHDYLKFEPSQHTASPANIATTVTED